MRSVPKQRSRTTVGLRCFELSCAVGSTRTSQRLAR